MNMDDILATKVTDATPGFGAAVKVVKDGYNKLVAHGNLTTYSTVDILHACPRKYQIKKLQAASGTSDRINSATFAFGHAVGAGVATYDATRDLRSAIWEAFLAWDIDLFLEERKTARAAGKSFFEAIWALYAYEEFYQSETRLADYDTVKIEGTIAIDFEDGHFYSGHIDEVLQHRETGRYLVKENKTSGFSNIDPVLYANSDQALSYSIVVDMLGGTEYEVLYTVYSATSQKWMQFEFVKNALKKAEWIQDQLLIHSQIDSYQELGFFPKRGRSCFNFMRRCEYFETCEFSTQSTFGMTYAQLPRIQSLADIQAIEHVDYPTTLTEITNRQRERLNHHGL
jgi:hypothetical protein